jgi:hypothetical protein
MIHYQVRKIVTCLLTTATLFLGSFPAYSAQGGAKGETNQQCTRYGLPDSLSKKQFIFAGDPIPIDRSDVAHRIVSQINFLLLDAKSVLADWLTEISRFGWYYEEVLSNEGIPKEFAQLSPILATLARSGGKSSGAGPWSIDKLCTGSEVHDMMEDSWHDDRLDPDLSTRCFSIRIKALRKALGEGSWLMAASAYLTSEKAVQESQQRWDSKSFWDIPMPARAEDVIVRWIALSLINADKGLYGLNFHSAPPLVFDQVTGVTLNKDLSLAELAKMLNIPAREAVLLNPKIKTSSGIFPATFKGKPIAHSIAVPKGKGRLLLAELNRAGYSSSSVK